MALGQEGTYDKGKTLGWLLQWAEPRTQEEHRTSVGWEGTLLLLSLRKKTQLKSPPSLSLITMTPALKAVNTTLSAHPHSTPSTWATSFPRGHQDTLSLWAHSDRDHVPYSPSPGLSMATTSTQLNGFISPHAKLFHGRKFVLPLIFIFSVEQTVWV